MISRGNSAFATDYGRGDKERNWGKKAKQLRLFVRVFGGSSLVATTAVPFLYKERVSTVRQITFQKCTLVFIFQFPAKRGTKFNEKLVFQVLFLSYEVEVEIFAKQKSHFKKKFDTLLVHLQESNFDLKNQLKFLETSLIFPYFFDLQVFSKFPFLNLKCTFRPIFTAQWVPKYSLLPPNLSIRRNVAFFYPFFLIRQIHDLRFATFNCSSAV